jgi:uncharacterized damage-inducible protein DinB
MATVIADFFKFNLWANLRVLDACAGIDDAQLDATVRGTFGSVRETLVHIVAAEEGYVQRFTGQRLELALHKDDPFPGFDELRRRVRQSGEGLIAIAEQFDAAQVLHLSYQGQLYAVPAIFVLIQAINHATDHRSQVATVLSQQDVTPPELDGWSYYWACDDEMRKSDEAR